MSGSSPPGRDAPGRDLPMRGALISAPILAGVLPRLALALGVAGLLWLAVLWALA